VVVEGVPGSPEQWAADHAWELAARPGWADAWEAPDDDHDRAAAITDEMITDAVRDLRQEQS
jgi:hypothetical protein